MPGDTPALKARRLATTPFNIGPLDVVVYDDHNSLWETRTLILLSIGHEFV
jgi:hypothetical protein